MKNDIYRRARGGKAEVIEVVCVNCSRRVLTYQKDGRGNLLRCYLNRIMGPDEYESLQYSTSIREPKHMPNLYCECKSLIGTPMRHKDGRLAFRLIRGSYQRKRKTNEDD